MRMQRLVLCTVSFVLLLVVVAGARAPVSPREAPAGTMTAQKKEMKGMGKMPMKMEMATEGIFEGVGKVIALVPSKSQLVVGHEEIKGFMKAMPMGMGYAVESAELFKGLKPGDAITFKIDAAKKKIIAIEEVP